MPSVRSRSAQAVIAALPEERWRTLSWRRGAKGDLQADFAALRVRVAVGPVLSGNRRLPGEAAWLVCERRTSGERKYYLSNDAGEASLESLAGLIKSRWICEQAHQQMKEELDLDHFEGRSWLGLHHHALMTTIAFAFLQHLRLGEKTTTSLGPPPSPSLPQVRRQLVAALSAFAQLCPHYRQPVPYHLRL